MNHLLTRGEDPKNIRILDIRAPTRTDLTQGVGKLAEFVRTDITDEESVIAGFTKEWPPTASPDSEITVFCTAANIRFHEKHPALVPLSVKVNVTGVENVIKGSLACGATILIATSSGSIGVRSTRFLLAPWESEPMFFAQVLRDGGKESTRSHRTFFSNYGYTKMVGEVRVLAADKSSGASGRTLRTGAIRPGNGVYGVGGDHLIELYLKDPNTRFTWIPNIVHHFISVENCSLAHLCYEQRLIESGRGGRNPDVGGRSFIVTDAGPPISYGDCYRTIEVLAEGDIRFQVLSPSLMLLFAHVIQMYYLATYFLFRSPNIFLRAIAAFLPRLPYPTVNLQPSLWNLTSVHLIFDSSNARARPEAGGLGYEPLWTSLEGICQLVLDYRSRRVVDDSHSSGGQSSLATSEVPGAQAGVKQDLKNAGIITTHPFRLAK